MLLISGVRGGHCGSIKRGKKTKNQSNLALAVSRPGNCRKTNSRRRLTDRGAVLLLLDERQHAGEDAGAHDQVSLLLHVSLQDAKHHRQQDASGFYDDRGTKRIRGAALRALRR